MDSESVHKQFILLLNEFKTVQMFINCHCKIADFKNNVFYSLVCLVRYDNYRSFIIVYICVYITTTFVQHAVNTEMVFE